MLMRILKGSIQLLRHKKTTKSNCQIVKILKQQKKNK